MLSVGRIMSGRTETEMWAAFREIDRRLSSLIALRDYLEREEGVADAAAFRVEGRVWRLGREFRDLEDERTEAQEWLANVVRGGVTDLRSVHRAEKAREMLRKIHEEALAICTRAREVDERRNIFRYSEEYCEMSQYSLDAEIERLQADLASIIAAGFVSG
mgnify:CR=1 FL=1